MAVAGDGMSARPASPARIARWAGTLVASVCLLLVCFFNLSHFVSLGIELPDRLMGWCYAFRLHQKWGMFTNVYNVPGGWFLVVGRTRDGGAVDVLEGGALSPERPRRISASYPNHNSRVYWHRIALEKSRVFRPYLARYLCDRWNERHGSDRALEAINVYYVEEKTLPGYRIAEPEAHVLIDYDCRSGRETRRAAR